MQEGHCPVLDRVLDSGRLPGAPACGGVLTSHSVRTPGR